MKQLRLLAMVGFSICAALSLCACSDDSDTSSHPTKEYVLAQKTLAADSIEDFGTLADAVSNDDRIGVASLETRGKAFMLAAGTRVVAGEITGGVCGGTVSSGEYISKDIVLACSQLGQ